MTVLSAGEARAAAAALVWPAVALLLILAATAAGGPVATFIDPASALIVGGGTALATAASHPWATLRELPGVLGTVLTGRRAGARRRTREALRGLAEVVRRGGPRALHAASASPRLGPLTRFGAELIADGVAAERIDRAMAASSERLLKHHADAAHVLERAAEIAPAMGLIGTLLGLVRMLDSLDRPDALGPAMAVALLTTFYAAVLANVLLHPLAARIRASQVDLAADLELIVRGISAVAAGEHPDRLEAALADVPAVPSAVGLSPASS